MKGIRKWLQEVESKLRKLKLSDDCATEEMMDMFNQEKVSDRGLPGHEFDPSTTKDPPCRAVMHVKSVES
ncbi:hypothetical protein TNCV_3809501 [Trichonephila clavipes]|nr:hypothetical protein TNCV_3809501 [Trichonephila clavipes]